MKYIFVSALFLLFQSLSYARPSDEVIPSYTIIKNELDHSLSNKESIFVFAFKNIPLPAKIKGSCNGVQKTISTPTSGEYSLKTNPGKYKFQFYYNDDYYEIYTDSIEIKPGYKIEVNINFESSLYPVIMDKPVIYAYHTALAPIHINLNIGGEFSFTYPTYNSGWDFTATPDGNIYMNDKTYKYLFWEGATNINANKINWNEGSIVEKKDLLSFLENALTTMGLSSTEQQDYITYWYPLMSKNDSNYIHFLFNEDYNEYANISISPKPDNMFRVFMLWENAAEMKYTQLKPQSIPTFKKEGFTIVEWGGAQLQQMPKIAL